MKGGQCLQVEKASRQAGRQAGRQAAATL